VCVTDNNNNNNSNNNKVEIIGHKEETKINKQKARRGMEGRSDGGEESDGNTNTGGTRHGCTDEINRKQDINTSKGGKEADVERKGKRIEEVWIMEHPNQGEGRGEYVEEESEGDWEVIGGLRKTGGSKKIEEWLN
jgi:hypothetical protein